MDHQRIRDVQTFYHLMSALDAKIGGARALSNCSGRQDWPRRGVYFFFEDGEWRTDSGSGRRIVRIGTHALKDGSKTKLWTRLSQHRGQENSGGGNHRGSIFRLIVGTALIARHGYDFATWGQGNNAPAETRVKEIGLEREVSSVIRGMPFLWLSIDDDAGAESLRGYIERNSIALLSNFAKEKIDQVSKEWLGNFCDRKHVRESLRIWADL
jgi:hypothetical protein